MQSKIKASPSPAAEAHTKTAEGLGLKMYKCPAGYNTVGWGWNLDANAIPPEVAELLFQYSWGMAKLDAQRSCTGFWDGLGPARQEAVTDMVFNLGQSRFDLFVKFRQALARQNWPLAAREMQDSKWFKQVGLRSKRLQYVILHGSWEGSGVQV